MSCVVHFCELQVLEVTRTKRHDFLQRASSEIVFDCARATLTTTLYNTSNIGAAMIYQNTRLALYKVSISLLEHTKKIVGSERDTIIIRNNFGTRNSENLATDLHSFWRRKWITTCVKFICEVTNVRR